MAALKWREIRAELAQRHAAPEPRPAPAFWADFRARLAVAPGRVAAAARRRRLSLGIAWATAALAVLVGAVALFTPGGERGAAPSAVASQVEDIKVFVPYSGVIIMHDAEHGGTLVWVAGMGSESNET